MATVTASAAVNMVSWTLIADLGTLILVGTCSYRACLRSIIPKTAFLCNLVGACVLLQVQVAPAVVEQQQTSAAILTQMPQQTRSFLDLQGALPALGGHRG
jgi:hypothetical protein